MKSSLSSTRGGFTIVEVVISLVLMSIILTTLGGLTFSSARMAVLASDATERETIMLSAVNRVTATAAASLVDADTIVGTVNNEYRVEVDVINAGAYDSVRITVTPQQRNVPASGVSLLRSRPPGPNPLCTSC